MQEPTSPADVLIVGGGNAAMCAALSAREAGAEVVVLERAPEGERGGNTAFTAGAMRVVYNDVDHLRELVRDLSDSEIETTDFGAYPAEQFYEDMARVTEYRADPDLVEVLVERSHDTLRWMADHGIRFVPAYGRQAFKIDGKFRFWGGLTIDASGGGPGLVEAQHTLAAKSGVDIRYGAPVNHLLADDDGVHGVRARIDGRTVDVPARAVVLASGGFEANLEWRTRYLGPGWDLAKVRGTRFNTGDGHRMAFEAGASAAGHWSGCHAVGWDRNAPEFGDLAIGDSFQKHSYPLGIMVNANGRRFVDEGEDFRNYTYAKYGSRILAQPGQFAWQVFDQKVVHLLRDEYRIRQVTKVQAPTLSELADRLEGVDPEGFLDEVSAYNSAVMTEMHFDPTVKDGRGTRGLAVRKSNWANTLDEPPYVAFQVTCGITFTFGGLRITPQRAEVVSTDGAPIPGLYAAGEIVGGIFFHNYPGGTGLTSGSVFGRIAGASAAASRFSAGTTVPDKECTILCDGGSSVSEIDMTGKVAVITGAGRGIGRAHALMLASRGASIVVNDLGVQPRGEDPDASVAVAVVEEIIRSGGRAVASTDTVATPEGGAAIAQTALDAFGKIDLLVHNAGVVSAGTFGEQPIEEVVNTISVHLLGAWHVGQPAWRDMEKRNYGRIVLTSSMAQFGHYTQGAYAAAKTGIIGLVKSLAHEAETKGLDIKVNAICPLAGTRLARPDSKERWKALMDPDNVAAVAAYLLSDACTSNGGIFHAGGSHVAIGFLGQTQGWAKREEGLTPEDVRDHLGEASDRADYAIPTSANDQMNLVERFVIGAPS